MEELEMHGKRHLNTDTSIHRDVVVHTHDTRNLDIWSLIICLE